MNQHDKNWRAQGNRRHHFHQTPVPTGSQFSTALPHGGRVISERKTPAVTKEYNSLYATLTGETIRVTSGFVNGTEVPTLGGDPLSDIPAPTLALGTLPFYVCLRVEWLPLADGTTPDFYAAGVASFASITIVGEDTSIPAVTTPTVNATTGAVTQNGIAYFTLAHYVDDGNGNAAFSSRNSGNRWFAVCGADEAKFVWNGQ
jgi:hypothetical protein